MLDDVVVVVVVVIVTTVSIEHHFLGRHRVLVDVVSPLTTVAVIMFGVISGIDIFVFEPDTFVVIVRTAEATRVVMVVLRISSVGVLISRQGRHAFEAVGVLGTIC